MCSNLVLTLLHFLTVAHVKMDIFQYLVILKNTDSILYFNFFQFKGLSNLSFDLKSFNFK